MLMAVSLVSVSFGQVRFGVKGGLNIANQKIILDFMGTSIDRSGDAIATFHIGGVADIPLGEHFSFRPELLLSGKGSNFDATTENGDNTKANIRPYYLEIPLNIVYRHQFASGLRFFGGAGPDIAYGLFGKAKADGQSSDVFEKGGYKRFDFGLNILAGLELSSGITVSANFTPGLANIYDGEDISGAEDIKFKNTTFGISVGYMFSK